MLSLYSVGRGLRLPLYVFLSKKQDFWIVSGVCMRLTYGPETSRSKDYKFVDVGQPANIIR